MNKDIKMRYIFSIILTLYTVVTLL